jgi:ribonuclease P protein component
VTKKERNNPGKPSSKIFGLPRRDILRGRKHFRRLFEGQVIFFSARHIALRFYTTTEVEFTCKMGFIAAKKLGKAAERNHLKRLLREAYRLHRHSLMDALQASSTGFYGALIGKTAAVNFKTVESETIHLLQRTVNHLQVSQSS